MRLTPHSVKTPTWTQSDYGEPIAAYSDPKKVPMFVGWIDAMKNNIEGSVYQQYDFVALSRVPVEVGAIIDDKYVVGYVQPGRIHRAFMNYADGTRRSYVDPEEDSNGEQQQADSSEHTEGS